MLFRSVLDIALRLEQLLTREPGVEVVLTRRTDVFVPLEERTAIANRQNADLFLSIHANASRNAKARGVETYFLNFASTPDAEAVAARENSASGRTMHSLPDIVKAITLNNKLDESRDFATIVQREMVGHLSASNKDLRDLGVKQAPFVVLIGAGMLAKRAGDEPDVQVVPRVVVETRDRGEIEPEQQRICPHRLVIFGVSRVSDRQSLPRDRGADAPGPDQGRRCEAIPGAIFPEFRTNSQMQCAALFDQPAEPFSEEAAH